MTKNIPPLIKVAYGFIAFIAFLMAYPWLQEFSAGFVAGFMNALN